MNLLKNFFPLVILSNNQNIQKKEGQYVGIFSVEISLGIFSKGFKCFAGYVDDSSSGVDYRIAFRDFTCIYSCRKSAISESTGGSLRFIYSRHTDIGSTVCCVLWCTRLITNDSNRCFLME